MGPRLELILAHLFGVDFSVYASEWIYEYTPGRYVRSGRCSIRHHLLIVFRRYCSTVSPPCIAASCSSVKGTLPPPNSPSIALNKGAAPIGAIVSPVSFG